MAFCTKCGTKVESRFCPNCGYDVGGTDIVAREDTALASTPSAASSETVKETVKQLYALRAGISFVAREKDKYDRVRASGEQQIRKLTESLERKRKEAKRQRAQIAELSPTARYSDDEEQASLEAELVEKSAKVAERNQRIYNLEDKSSKLFTAFLWVALILILPLAVIGMIYNTTTSEMIMTEYIAWLLVLASGVLFFIWGLGLIHKWDFVDYLYSAKYDACTITISLLACGFITVRFAYVLQESALMIFLFICALIPLGLVGIFIALSPFYEKNYVIGEIAYTLPTIFSYSCVVVIIIFLLWNALTAIVGLGIFAILAFIAAVIALAVLLIKAIATLREIKKVHSRYPSDDAIERIKKALEALKKAKTASESLRAAEKAKSNLEEQIIRAEKELESVKAVEREKSQVALRAMNSVIESLIDGYSTLLDLRDWENLDLVIYYLETGRAESMKEGLHQVDRQRQNDNIVNALGIAARQISETISSGMRALGATIVGCAQVLSSQLSSVSEQLDSIEASQARLGGKVARLEAAAVSEREIVEAMKAKADTSSRELMDEISEVRRMVSR